jgi:5-methylcytosine-specific restriction protein B
VRSGRVALEPSNEPVRLLDAEDLGVGPSEAIAEHGSNRPDDPPLEEDDPRLVEVLELLDIYGGIIFSGPPGTSKSWTAAKVGFALAEHDEQRIVFLQFHPSYQYEDFMIGLVPNANGIGFEIAERPFLKMCRKATDDPAHTYVIVIDELSRCDPGRVFGEALTYLEKSKRGLSFQLPMGDQGGQASVPPNLVLLATMNPLDRGVDDVDAAFERRFAKIAMEPDERILDALLETNGADDALRERILNFFRYANGAARQTPLAAVGHTFFTDVGSEHDLERLWRHQLQFLFRKAYRLNPRGLTDVEKRWDELFSSVSEDPAALGEASAG